MSTDAQQTSAPVHSREFRARRLANWFPLGLTYATLYMGRYNFNVSKDTIGELHHLDKAQMGIIATAGFWTYALSVLVNGPLADRLGGRRAILTGTLGACVLNLACGVATRFGLDLPGEAGHWVRTDAKLTMAGVTDEVLEQCAENARAHYQALCATLL